MSDTWHPDLSGFDGPKYLALLSALRLALRGGKLTEGMRLPPVRELAWKLSVTPGTVARAYQIGAQEGLLDTVVGRGTFVAARSARLGPSLTILDDTPPGEKLARNLLADLRSARLPDVGQQQVIAAILRDLADGPAGDYVDYPSMRQDYPLRQAYCDWLADQGLGPMTADDLVLTLGGQNGLGVAMQCCLRGERPHVFCEELAYVGFRLAARLNRAEVVPVALDGQGMVPEALDQVCRRYGGRIVCLTPDAQNPTAGTMDLERRTALVRVARAHDLQIFEDNCYSISRPAEPSLRMLAPERTWTVTSLSKSIAAGLRFGAVACPPGLGHAARLTGQNQFFGLPGVVADIALALLRSGQAAHLREAVLEVTGRRLELTLNGLGHHDLKWQRGLGFVWLTLPPGRLVSTFVREAEAAGVLVRSADEFAMIDGRAPRAVRIALSGAVADTDFSAAMKVLAGLLDSPAREMAV